MMVWKLAISPITARNASILAAALPYNTRKPSSSGSPLVASENEPCILSAAPTLEFRNVMSSAEIISVNMPRMSPLGMSFFGSADSSAASGNCSMARNSHTANGNDSSTPFNPNGNHGPPPSGEFDRLAVFADADVQRPTIEVDGPERTHPVDGQDGERTERDEHGDAEREFDAVEIQQQEHQVRPGPPQRVAWRLASRRSPTCTSL